MNSNNFFRILTWWSNRLASPSSDSDSSEVLVSVTRVNFPTTWRWSSTTLTSPPSEDSASMLNTLKRSYLRSSMLYVSQRYRTSPRLETHDHEGASEPEVLVHEPKKDQSSWSAKSVWLIATPEAPKHAFAKGIPRHHLSIIQILDRSNSPVWKREHYVSRVGSPFVVLRYDRL